MAAQAGAIRAGRAFVELYADSSRFVAGLRQAETKLRQFGQNVQNLGMRMTALGTAALSPFAISTKVYKDFDDVMLSVKAVTGATGDEFDTLTEKAKYLGRTTSFTAAQVGSAMLELGRAGFAAKEIDDSIASIMNLARATGTDLAEATNIAAATLRAFGMDASDMTRVADVLTATANTSAQTLSDLGESMKYAAPVADLFGLSLEDASKSLGILANVGIKGSMAGTTLKNIMLRLTDSSIRSKLKQLGVTVSNANGDFRNLADILTDLGKATQNMGDVEKLSIFNEIFGLRAIAGGSKLTTETFIRLINAIDHAAGTAQRTAQVMDSGLGGALRRMWSAVEGVGLAIGRSLSKPLSISADLFAVVSNKITEWTDKHRALVVVLGAFAASLLVAGTALIGLGLTLKLMAFALDTMRTVLGAIVGVFKGVKAILMALLNPLALLAVLVAALSAAFVVMSGVGQKALSALQKKFSDLKSDALNAWGGIVAAYASGDLGLAARIAWLTVKEQWAKGVAFLETKWLEFKTFFLKAAFGAFYGALAAWEFVQNAIVVGVIEASAAAAGAWNVFVSWWKKAIEGTAMALAKVYNWMMSLMDENWDGAEFMRQMTDSFHEGMDPINRQLEAKQNEAEQTRRQMRDAAQKDHEDRLREITDADKQRREGLEESLNQELEGISQELAQAKEDLKNAIQKAKQQATEKAEQDKVQERASRLRGAVGMAGAALDLASATSAGTFSAAALSGLGAGGVSQKIADNTAATARHTETIARNTEDGATFT
ncbi:MAG TPA: phage tail tape measure protein [Anaerohalosphaeraceae bacterium]|nr:phage tail tape measure protein [Anaerohalosphaeraceae bacterium]